MNQNEKAIMYVTVIRDDSAALSPDIWLTNVTSKDDVILILNINI
jgi:hypothetical protein